MGLLAKIRGNNTAGLTVGVVLILVAAVFYFHNRVSTPALPDFTKAYYTDDDGKTYFRDSAYNFAPFDHNGKEADIALLFTCDSGNFVGIIARYTPQMKKLLDQEYAKAQADPAQKSSMMQMISAQIKQPEGMEMRSPGSRQWIPRSQGIPLVKTPDGSAFRLVPP